MHTQTVLDFVIFQLTPTRTRCELYAAAGDETEKLASGMLKPFLSHVQAVKEQLAKGGHSIRLEPPQQSSWFTKGTLQRFIRFVGNPDVLERVNTIEVELMQLGETIRMQSRNSSTVNVQRFWSNLLATTSPKGRKRRVPTKCQMADQLAFPGSDGDSISGNSRTRLLHALEARRSVLRKEQRMSFARAAAAGFDSTHLKELILFSDCFGAIRLREACLQFTNLYKRRREARYCMEGLATAAGIQSDGPLSPHPKSQIKSYLSVDGGGLRVSPEEGCTHLGTDLKESFHGARWTCTPDENSQISTCSFADAEGHCLSNTQRQKLAVKGTGSPDEGLELYGCGLQGLSLEHAAEGHSLVAEDFRERERAAGMVTHCSHHTQICCCCNDSLKGLQLDQTIWTSFCLASCKDTSRHWLPESRFSSLINETAPREPLQDFINDGCKSCLCALHHKSDNQGSDPCEIKCLLSQNIMNSTTAEGNFAHDYSSLKRQGIGITQRHSKHDHDHGGLSDMVVMNNQIFTVSPFVNQFLKDDNAEEMAGECCKDQGFHKGRKHDCELSHLSVRDVVSLFESKCQDQPLPKEKCQRQDSHISDNIQKGRKIVLEDWTADGVSIGGEYCNDKNQEIRKMVERINTSNGGETTSNGKGHYKLEPKEKTALQCSSDTHYLKPQVNAPILREVEAGCWNPLYQEQFKTPSNTRLCMECTTGNLSNQRSFAKGNSSKLDFNQHKFPAEKDSAKTSCDSEALQTNGNVSMPSEERVKKFLDRYYEKRQLRLKNRTNANKKDTDLNLKKMQAALDEKQDRNHQPSQLIVLNKTILQANNPQPYRSTQKSKKEKVNEEQKRIEELKVRRRERISVGTNVKSSAFTTASHVQNPGSMKLTFKVSSGLAAPAKASVAGFAAKQKCEVELSSAGASKRLRNPLTSSAPSLIKIQTKTVGTTSSLQASIGSQPSADKKGRNTFQSRTNSLVTVPGTFDLKASVSEKKVKPPVAETKDQGMYLHKSGKRISLPNSNSTGANEGPKNFLRKGAGARSRVGVLQPKVANSKEVATQQKSAHILLSPTSKSQVVGKARGQESLAMSTQCSTTPTQGSGRAETRSSTNAPENSSSAFGDSVNEYEGASQQESEEGLEGNVHATAASPLNSSLQSKSPPKSDSRSSVTASFPEEVRLLIPANMQPICYGSQVESSSTSEDASLNTTIPCTPIKPPISLQSSVYTHTYDPFEIPSTQAREIPNARYVVERSNHFVGSRISEDPSSKIDFQQSGTKWGTSRYISFVEPHARASSQGKDLKKLLNFRRKSVRASGRDSSDQASASIFSEEDEGGGSFSEPESKIIDCYGRKRHSNGKALHVRTFGNDFLHCSPSMPENDESKSRKTIIPFKRSVSTHEVRSKPKEQELSQPSAAKATRAFFSLAPFRRRAVEGKS